MALDRTNQPLVGILDPTLKTNEKVAQRRRRFCYCGSTPQADSVRAEINSGKDWLSIEKVAIYFIAYMGIFTTCFYLLRHQIKGKKTNGILDTVYFCIVTMCTVGYGDLVPDSVASKLLTCAFVFSGMALVVLILCKGAEYLVEKQERLLDKAIRSGRKVSQPEKTQKEIGSNKAKHKCIMVLAFLVVLIVVGTVLLVKVEKLDLIDAFYCVCCTITTLGYGDKSFTTEGGRIFAIFWILIGTLCFAQFLLYVSELSIETRQKAWMERVLTRRMTIKDLEAADLDKDGVVGATEFFILKLKEMGKITEEDISLLKKQFEALDVDQSGTLSASEIVNAR